MQSKLSYYTFYLLDGTRKVLLGESEKDAYYTSQSMNNRSKAIEHVEEGITLNYSWDDLINRWVPFKHTIFHKQYLSSVSNIDTIIKSSLNNGRFCMILENKNELSITPVWVKYKGYYVKCFKMPYSKYDPNLNKLTINDITTGNDYYSCHNVDEVIDSFIKRINSKNPENNGILNPLNYDDLLDSILALQTPEIIYGSHLTAEEIIWLISSHLSHLKNEMNAIKSNISKDNYDNHWLVILRNEIEYFVKKLFSNEHDHRTQLFYRDVIKNLSQYGIEIQYRNNAFSYKINENEITIPLENVS